MTQQNPYLELVKSDVATEVQSSMQSAADKNPDTEAKLQAMAKAANVPIDTARLDTQAVQRQVDLSLDYKKLAERYPSTAQLLTDPANAALAKDDLPAISRLEDTLNFGKNMFRSVGAATTAASTGLWGVAQAGAETAAGFVDPLVGTVLPQNPFEVMADKIRDWRTIAKSDTKVIEGDQAGMGFVQQSALSGAKSLGQSLLMVPAAIATRDPRLLLVPMAVQTGGEAYGEARDKRIPVSGSLAFGASQMMIEYATERIPAITLLRDVGLQSSFKKMLLNQVVHEVPGEQVATVFQDLNEWAVLHPEKPFSEYLAERPSAAAQTLIATIVATGGQAGIGAAASRVANGSRQQQTVDMLTALKDGVVDSKTFERAPQRVRDFIAAHTKDGPLENVFIPAEQLTKYFQDTGINPAIAAAAMGATNYDEAHSAGTDVVIPLADFVANVAKTPHYDVLLPDIRFAQGEMTARELDLYEKNHPDEVKRMVEEAKNFQLPVDSPAITQITDDITGQLVADGMPRDTADSYATLYAKTIANLAGRSGMDPLALHQKYGLQIVRPMADVLTKLKNSDIQIDPLLDRLRSGDVPTDAVVNGPALMEFLRGIGGLKDTGGELRRMEVDTGIAPFVRNLIQQIDGKEVDEAAALAQEAGYPVQDILDAIAEEMQGKPIYSAHNANEQMLGLQRDLHNLGEYLNSIGVDLANATNDQVRQAMAAAIGSVYDQPAYHGSPYKFDKFSLDHIGSGEGNQAYGYGLYFAGNKAVAEYYRDVLSGGEATYRVDGKDVFSGAPDPNNPHERAVYVMANGGEKAARALIEQWRDEELDPAYINAMEQSVNALVGKAVERIDPKNGQLYQVEIPEDKDMLLWDKPLSEQPEVLAKIRKLLESDAVEQRALEDFGMATRKELADFLLSPELTGGELYGSLTDVFRTDKEASLNLNLEGIEGIKYLDGSSRGADATEVNHNFVLFNDNAIKILTTLYQSGTNNQASGQGGGSNPAPVFYSALQRALPQLAKVADKSGMVNPEQVTQWLAARQKEGKFKAAELEWSGLPEMLAAQSGKISVADIEAFVRDNGVQVQEVMKGAPKPSGEYTDADRQAAKDYFQVRGFDDMSIEEQNAYVDDMIERGYQAKDDGNTKYEKYTLPGGENYRELLLTLPKADDVRQAKLDRINAKFDTLPPAGERTPAQEQLVLDLTAEHNAIADAPTARDFHHTTHWTEPNILAHIRFNERIDADGKRVLFIEELQSDWGQQGKKKGFSEKRTEWPVEFSNGDVGYYKTEAEARRIAEANGGTVTSAQSINGIPAAPFVTDTKNWLALGIKRMVRYAAENGFDKVAFINGEQAADRFDLSKQIQNVQATKTLQGAYHIKAIDHNGRVVLDDVYGADGLPDVIGKDLAEKVVAEADKAHAEKGIETLPDDYQISLDRQTDAENPYTIIPPGQSHGRPFAGRHASEKEAIDAALARINNERSRTVTFSGLDLKVGGDGMKAFYDKIVPQVANDVLKKLGGGKVGEVNMITDNALTRGMNYSGPELSLVRLRERQIEMVDNLPSAVLRQMTEVGMAMDTGGLSFTQAMEAYASPAAAKALGGTMENRQAAANPQPGFDITPAMRESVMGGQALFQSAVKPIATLVGDELGVDLSADNVVERARDWFKSNLQGKSIEREGLGPVRVSGKGWAKLRRGLTTDLDKARLIPAIANIIQHGQYSGRQPLNKERTDDIVAFHYFTGAVDLAGKSILAGVTVAEDSHGNLFYNLNQNPQALQEKTKASHLPGIDSARDARLSKDGKTNLDQSIDHPGDGINLTILTQSKDVKRGFIQFGPDRKFKIGLLEDVNLSTFLHETGHFWLEVMGDLSQAADASQEIKDDYAAILKFLKVESREQIGVEQHEMFARANEAYLREGKAPSPELRGMFQRFKAWLEMIYKAADELNVKLNDEVRGVFDRLYASDAEIEAAKHELDVSALLTSASEASMSDAEFAAYQKSLEGEVARAKDELGARLMRQFQRERNKWWKDELAKFEVDVTAEVDAQTDQNAFATLVQGALPDGTFIKLDRAELLEKYGKEYIKRLPRGKQAVYDSKGKGWALQDAAELLGFQTGDELVQALVNLRPRKELIAAEAKARMIERHGDMLTDGTIHDEATEALHNEERAKRLAFELKVIRRKQREVKPFVNAAMQQDKQQAQAATDVPPIQAFRDAARGLIGQKQVRELSPYSYLLAERKASKNAFAAMAKKDYQTAAIEKQRELLNHHLFLEATRAREEVDAIVSHMAKLGRPAARERIGKAGHDYLDQIDTLLEQYQFQNVSQRQIDRRKSLMEWYQEQVDNGFEPVIDAELLANARSLNYKELPVDQVRAINDAVRSIEHLASLKNKLLANKKGMEFDQAVDELVAIAEDNNGKINRPYDPEQRTAGEKTADWFAAKDRALVNVRTMVAWLDGGKVDGPWHTLLFNPASDAQTAQLDMMKSVGKPVNDLMEKYMEGAGERMLDKFTTPLGVVSRKFLMSIAFNLGSESSFDKMLRGGPGGRVEGGARVQWNEATIRGMVANLDAKDWKFVQGIWTILDTKMYPQINDLTKRVSGVPLEKVVAKPFTITTRDGETIHMEGGYYPLKYDPKFSQAGLKQESGPLAGLTEVGYSSATTSRGHTKARIEGFAAPLLLDFTHILQVHLANAIKDLTHREFLMDAQKILRNDRIRQVLQERIGTQYEGEFMSWLKRIANDGNSMPDMNFMDKFVEVARTNATIVSLGYKVSTIIAQAGGLFNAIEHPNVGPGWFYRGLSESTRHPVESYAMVVEKSGEMRHRFDTIDQTVREVLSKVQTTKYGKVQDGITRSAFIGINIADRMVTIPTWIAAYRKAVASGIAEEEAIHAADDAVVGSQGAGAAKDINSVQAARGAIKAFTMFYTPFAAQYNRMRSIGRAAGQQGWKYTPEAAMRVMMITFFPAVLMDLLTSRGPTHCDASDTACYAKWLAVKMVSSQTATLPFIRDIGNGLEQYVSGKQGNVKISPLIMALDKVWNSVKHGFETGFGDRQFDQKQAFDIFESSGYLMGLPTGQARITSEYLADLMAGNNSPDSVGSFLHDLVFRREKK